MSINKESESAAGDAFNNTFHKVRAEVSMDWWQRIWAKAVEWERGRAAVIHLTPYEMQCNHSRVNWAEGLIRQLPEDHDGRNSWLLNYGGSPRPKDMLAKHDLYTDADPDRPDVICDSNGQVTLDLCKRCGKGEAELLDAPCVAAPTDETLLHQALGALEHHREQTRPIHRTTEAIAALRARLNPQPAIQHLPSDDSEGGLA